MHIYCGVEQDMENLTKKLVVNFAPHVVFLNKATDNSAQKRGLN